ncbi:DUF7674 family protein [Reinekea blandensis]|uniref:DUF7674 domain-containing protein n=1 Tax=Reinekea blandensis MED297 TaxID=314283 RepID=A4BFC0_9GAMM|nr:hypothetical protein [Reinekea blandensis]EAR09233.1 hypothetical protein MED297_07118 [Reinekea sp. MED297] [Reinekea blandensis MED297]
MNSSIELFHAIREKFPEFLEAADKEHVRIWDEVTPETHYSWFESLANAINELMSSGEMLDSMARLFEYLSEVDLSSGIEIKQLIDVSFVENLFWEVSPGNAAKPWYLLPENLKKYYVEFHLGTPL